MSNQKQSGCGFQPQMQEKRGCGFQPQLQEKTLPLEATATSATLIVGIGSAHGDDRVGWLVAEQLREFADRNQFELRIAKSPADLLDWLEGNQRLVICDACHGQGEIGELSRWLWPAPDISEITMSGTHNLSLPTVLTLAEKLGRLPNEVVIWAIEGATRQSTAAMSPAVMEAVPTLAGRITNDLVAPQPLGAKICTNNR